MAANIVIRADVVDISKDTPRNNENFLVDTNVWYWMTYSKASLYSLAAPYQISSYPRYTQSALSAGAKLNYTGLNSLELTHVSERSEFNLVGGANTLKEFRHNHCGNRINVCAEIKSSFSQVESMGEYFEIDLGKISISNSIGKFGSFEVDGYDCLIADYMLSSGLSNIVTDDGDFASVAGITVFTANRNLIQRAQQAGKLLTRPV